MERTVTFRDRQELQSADLNNIEAFTRASIDHIVLDAIDSGKAYAGFSVAKTSATQLTVNPGRLYSAGAVFAREDSVVLDTFNVLPLVTKKRVAVVVWGQAIDSDVQPRDFLVDAQTGETEPQAVSMVNVRYCEVNLVGGVEAADPQYPVTDANVLVVAYALLDPSGIVSVEIVSDNQISNLANVDGRTAFLEIWRNAIGARVDSLSTDLSSIANKIRNYTLLNDFYDLSTRVIALEEELRKPRPVVNQFAGFWTDNFLTTDGTDTEFDGYSANVERGLRFGEQASSDPAKLTLVNPTDPSIVNSSGFLLPKYSHAAKLTTPGYNSEIDLSTVGSHTTQTSRQLTRSTARLRYGKSLTLSISQITQIIAGQYDKLGLLPSGMLPGGAWFNNTFKYYDGNTYTIDFTTLQKVMAVYRATFEGKALPSFASESVEITNPTATWYERFDEPYWDVATTTTQIAGSTLAQTFLWSSTSWLSQIGLYFTRVGVSGDVTVLITETVNGAPDLNNVLSRTTVPQSSIKAGAISGGATLPSAVTTLVPIVPVLLTSGRRYAVVLISAGQHFLAASSTDNAVLNGTLFRSTDIAGAFVADLNKDLKIDLYGAKFEKNRIYVEFNAFQLSGGANRLDIKSDMMVPPSTGITFELFLNGTWQPILLDGTGVSLSSLPAVVRLRAVFSGTTDLMPGMSINPSEVVLYRDSTSFTWVSVPKAPLESAEQVTVSAEIESFDTDINTLTATLLRGTGYTTVETADVTETVVLLDGRLKRTWTFSGLPGVTEYRLKLVGSTTDAEMPFVVINASAAEYSAA